MKVYFSARRSRRHELQTYARDLPAPITLTSRWLHRATTTTTNENLSVVAHEDFFDCLDADVQVSFTEFPKTPTRGGRHVEFGLALGDGQRILLVGPYREHAFHYFSNTVEWYYDWSSAKERLIELANDKEFQS
jgi:hypothetical protein